MSRADTRSGRTDGPHTHAGGNEKIIAVVGATGAQGGGLARAILGDPAGRFLARVLTRHLDSANAKTLADRGAEVVFADIDDVETVTRAFAGACAAFCVTNFWEHFSPEREIAQVRSMAQAAQRAGVGHVIWSTLEDTRRWVPLEDPRMPTLMRRYKVPHFDAKGEANQIFVELGIPTTFLLTSFYWDNLVHFPGMGPERRADGTLVIQFPMGDRKLPGIASEDIGRCAYGVFKRGRDFIGRTVGIAGEQLTGAEMAVKVSSALGRTVVFADVAPDVYRMMHIPHAAELANMFQFKHDFQEAFCGARDVGLSRTINPSLQTFDMWLRDNGSRIPVDCHE
jgi:uncharacterized protein YbjT (DUF2867 family)